MNWVVRLITLFCVIVASGCASLASYTVSESELEQYFSRQVEAFDRQQLEAGSPLSMSLKHVDVELGPDDRDVVVLDLGGEVALSALAMRLPVALALKVEGAPVYSHQDKAIYIRRLKLLDSQIESPYFSGDLKPVTETAMKLVAQMLETTPVYRLDQNDFWQRQLSSVPMDIQVKRGRLVIQPARD